jgi:hypothetical protein
MKDIGFQGHWPSNRLDFPVRLIALSYAGSCLAKLSTTTRLGAGES